MSRCGRTPSPRSCSSPSRWQRARCRHSMRAANRSARRARRLLHGVRAYAVHRGVAHGYRAHGERRGGTGAGLRHRAGFRCCWARCPDARTLAGGALIVGAAVFATRARVGDGSRTGQTRRAADCADDPGPCRGFGSIVPIRRRIAMRSGSWGGGMIVVLMGVSGCGKTTVGRSARPTRRAGRFSTQTTFIRRPTSPRWRAGTAAHRRRPLAVARPARGRNGGDQRPRRACGARVLGVEAGIPRPPRARAATCASCISRATARRSSRGSPPVPATTCRATLLESQFATLEEPADAIGHRHPRRRRGAGRGHSQRTRRRGAAQMSTP